MTASSSKNGTNFTINHLPYGVVSSRQDSTPRCAVAYKDDAIILSSLQDAGVFDSLPELPSDVFENGKLNAFAGLSPDVRKRFRDLLKKYLLTPESDRPEGKFVPLSEVQNHFPMETKNFSDFYCSYEHGQNCSAVFSGKTPPNWFSAPSVYNGRTSSLIISGTPVTRPFGVFSPSATANPKDHSSPPQFLPETQFDFELEMGIFLSKPVPRGRRPSIETAKSHIFGLVLLNDWSARMIQFFEMQPLGPFHGKGSGTSISAWITPIEALDEHAVCPRHDGEQSPPPMPHLKWHDSASATWNVEVTCTLIRADKEYKIVESNLNELHWTPLQMLAHLGSAGEGLSTGDIFGTGTISSSRTDAATGEKTGLACLWERKLPHQARTSAMPEGLETRLLEDGDEVLFEAVCRDRESGEVVFGFGECRGKVLPAVISCNGSKNISSFDLCYSNTSFDI